MSARHKLNALHLWSIVWVGIGLTITTQSLATGLFSAGILYVLYSRYGVIRPDGPSVSGLSSPHRRRRRRR